MQKRSFIIIQKNCPKASCSRTSSGAKTKYWQSCDASTWLTANRFVRDKRIYSHLNLLQLLQIKNGFLAKPILSSVIGKFYFTVNASSSKYFRFVRCAFVSSLFDTAVVSLVFNFTSE